MKNSLKLKSSIVEQELDSLNQTHISKFPNRLSADELEQVRKISFLEKQIEALHVVSKNMDSKEKNHIELLRILKEKLFTLSESHDLGKASFSKQINTIKADVDKMASLFTKQLKQFKAKHIKQHEEIAQFTDLEISQIKSQQKKQLFTQNDHSQQLSDLGQITQKLTSISDKLTDTVGKHDSQINILELNSHEQQNNINTLFEQTHDLLETDKKLIENQEVFAADIDTLNLHQEKLFSHTDDLFNKHKTVNENISTRNIKVDKQFKVTHWLTAIALVTVSSLGTAFYLHNKDQVLQLQAQNSAQDVKWDNQQSAISQKITDLEKQLIGLDSSLKNNEIDLVSYAQKQDVIGVQLNQLAGLVDTQNQSINAKLETQITGQNFYKQAQFMRKDGLAVYDQSWIKSQKNSSYTIQLMSSTSKSEILRFVKAHNLEGVVAFRESNLHGTTWFSVVNGKYNNKQSAMDAIANLPSSVMQNKPWVRSFKQLKITH